MDGPEEEAVPGTRRGRAISGVRAAIEDLRAVGVEAKIIGSLATGSFGPNSDVDFLILRCPRELKYAIEGKVEDRMGGIAFDVVYLDELSDQRRAAFFDAAIDADALR